MKKLIVAICFISSSAFAAKLEDVKILSFIPGRDNIELKLRTNDGPKDSYFYVDITKSDPSAFEKLLLVIKKLTGRDKYRLDLDIQSFSASPSGSSYKSDGIIFYGPDRDPGSIKAKTK